MYYFLIGIQIIFQLLEVQNISSTYSCETLVDELVLTNASYEILSEIKESFCNLSDSQAEELFDLLAPQLDVGKIVYKVSFILCTF